MHRSVFRETNERFQQLVTQFEARPECKSLPIDTFLTLPMQRITRMPLLVDAVCQRTEPETPEYRLTRKALVQLQKVGFQNFVIFTMQRCSFILLIGYPMLTVSLNWLPDRKKSSPRLRLISKNCSEAQQRSRLSQRWSK